MSEILSNSVFWIDVDKIRPNPYQPRREFDEGPLRDLAESIRQYGVLQPLTVSRVEKIKEDGGIVNEYELIAGERRLRASKLAGLNQVPALIRTGDNAMMKLELAIIENLQREDLNAVERARAFLKLTDEFKFTHAQVGQKVGKSREYVSNTLRLLTLPEEILNAVSEGRISEGHTRPLMMLSDRPDEQTVLFKEIMFKKISVREAERIARRIAFERARKKELLPDPEIMEIEEKMQEALGTRVHIEKKDIGGRVTIDFFSNEDLHQILEMLKSESPKNVNHMMNSFIEKNGELKTVQKQISIEEAVRSELGEALHEDSIVDISILPEDDRSPDEKTKDENDADLYNISNFTV